MGAEALLRWTNPHRGTVSPAQFIPHAERAGLMVPIGEWVLEQGCRTLADWARHPALRELTLAINVSASQFAARRLRGRGAKGAGNNRRESAAPDSRAHRERFGHRYRPGCRQARFPA
ncbi:EAL domain-containing protein [Paradevosia shaoguanensis]|uniref:EAL domain-containing protein n=1 Tax=Paradevosia shaoguanensis TaxID=1335043 RepID=UPI001932FC1E